MSNLKELTRRFYEAKRKAEGDMSDPTKHCDWRLTEVGRQNWEVCHRMLVHDLVDLKIPAVDQLLAYYNIMILPNGAHTAALPRLAYTRNQKVRAEDLFLKYASKKKSAKRRNK